MLSSVAVADCIKAQVEQVRLDGKSKLIKYLVRKSEDSAIVSDFQLSCIVERMQNYYRSCFFTLLYRRSSHGTSMVTFVENLKKQEATLLLIQDQSGCKFGAMCFDTWRPSAEFFGTGESFVFTFKNKGEF